MGYYVHLHTAFAVYEHEALKRVARDGLRAWGLPQSSPDGWPYPLPESVLLPEAAWFMAALAHGSPWYVGPKGMLCLWGIVSNGSVGNEFVHTLVPFWSNAFLADGIFNHQHVLVFEGPEQRGYASAWEIGLRESEWLNPHEEGRPTFEDCEPIGGLRIRFHRRLPFAWNQI